MSKPLDFFLYFGSTYTYLTVMRIEEAASAAGVAIRWRPFNVRDIMVEMDNIPFRTKPAKLRYMWRDLERRAKRYGLDNAQAPTYTVDLDSLAGRVGFVAAEQGWCPDYAKASYRAWFLENKPLGAEDDLRGILASVHQDPDQVIELANADKTRKNYEMETGCARGLGIFGSPTFVADREIFWGDDRLEDALDWCRQN